MDIRFLFVGGLRVACARWDSRGRARSVVQIVHGMGEHIGRYVSLIEVCDDSTQKSKMACRIASSSEQELKKAARGVQTGERIGHAAADQRPADRSESDPPSAERTSF